MVGNSSAAAILRYVALTPSLSPSPRRPGSTIAVQGPIFLIAGIGLK